jgi:3-isopropylmalate dehydrogenase
MNKTIALLPGDGIGPEIIDSAVQVLDAIAKQYHHTFTYKQALIGAVAIDQTGNPLPDETIDTCLQADAILLGAIGDPKYDNDPSAKIRPEQGLLKIRKALGLYANIRPVKCFDTIAHKSPLTPDRIKGVDFIVVRELTGGIYFGEPRGRSEDGNTAFDSMVYSKEEILRVSKIAFDLAMTRRKKVTLVDKANVLATSRLWRETVTEFAKNYPAVELETMFVDNAAQQIIKSPNNLDVIVTGNMFGDILTDEASVITGSLGMLPSASIGDKTSLYEPIHGSFPRAAGQNIANPSATILSAAMMLGQAFGLHEEEQTIINAIDTALKKEWGTKDLFPDKPLSTSEFTDKVIELL